MTTISTVLCPVDFSPLSETSLRLAIEICRRTEAKLVLEHNLECRPPGYLGVGWMWSEEHDARTHDQDKLAIRRIQKLFEKVPEGIEYEAKITRGPLEESLLHLARVLPASIIVMVTHGPSNCDHRSLTERIIIKAPCMVLTIGESYRPETVFAPDNKRPEDMSILVPFDFSARGRACLDLTFSMARRMPHRIHLLNVVRVNSSLSGESERTPDLEGLYARLAALIPADLDDRTTIDVVAGEPVPRILEAARAIEALFILMPAHGRNPLSRFLFGTTTLEVLHRAGCPVWFVPSAALRNPPEWAAA